MTFFKSSINKTARIAKQKPDPCLSCQKHVVHINIVKCSKKWETFERHLKEKSLIFIPHKLSIALIDTFFVCLKYY